ncbi:retrovirus-related pol polyprotein from transposon TNT 1-94 [Tanacetum coccineum]
MLYDGNVITKETNVISIDDSEVTLMLEEESRSKKLLKQNFGKRFVPQQELSAKQAFWFPMSNPSTDSSDASPVKVDVPSELPKASLVNASLKKLKFHLARFDSVVKKRTTPDALLEDIVNIVVNSSVDINDSKNVNVNSMEMCNKCLGLEAELIKQNMVEKDEYNKLSKSYSQLEQHCISLEISMQLNKEIFQKNNTFVIQTEPTFDQLFKVNNLKAQLQAKDTTIKKLKAQIKRVSETSTSERKGFCHDSIKNDLRKLKGKDIVNNVAQVSNATVIALGMYKLDPVILAPMDKNNRETHIYYLKHTMEQDVILREIVKQAKSLNPLDSASYTSCKYVKLIQELLGYVRDTCPDIHTPRVKPSTSASGSKPSGNTKNDRISQTPSSNEKNKVEIQSRKAKSSLNKKNSDSKNVCNEHVKHSIKGAKALCSICNKCLFDANHAMCLIDHVNRRTFTLVGNACPLSKITATNEVPVRVPIPLKVVAQEPVVTKVSTRRAKVVQIVLWYLDSDCSKHMSGDRSQLTNFVHKFLGTVKFSNDQIAKIMGYGDYHIGNVKISRVYYVEGLGHNLFSVGQFCESNLEVDFKKHICFVRNLKGVYLLLGSRGTNLYSFSIRDMMASSPIYLLLKATKTKSWLWHRRLSHLNFGAINHLAKKGLVRGLPRLKYEKDYLCSACSMVKSKKQSHKPIFEDTNQEKLYLLHMDLCGPMRVASVNGKRYILVIVDDYFWFTWVKFLASNDEAPDFIIKFLKMIQVRLNTTIRNNRTNNGTKFVIQTLRDYYEEVGISPETSVARTP